jgi:metal-responsive CopG/Arc/MetJ family transcriptional regulator
MSEKEPIREKGRRGVRISVQMPREIVRKVDKIAKEQYRSRSSVVTEACEIYVSAEPVNAAMMIAEKSPEYQHLLTQLRKDLFGKEG